MTQASGGQRHNERLRTCSASPFGATFLLQLLFLRLLCTAKDLQLTTSSSTISIAKREVREREGWTGGGEDLSGKATISWSAASSFAAYSSENFHVNCWLSVGKRSPRPYLWSPCPRKGFRRKQLRPRSSTDCSRPRRLAFFLAEQQLDFVRLMERPTGLSPSHSTYQTFPLFFCPSLPFRRRRSDGCVDETELVSRELKVR